MPWPGRTAPATSTVGAPPPPAPAPAGPTGGPPAPPAPAPSSLKFWVSLNGASVLKTEAECRALPPTTPAMPESQQGGWLTLAGLLPAGAPTAPAPAAGTRSAFGTRPAPQAAAPAPSGAAPASLFAGVESAEVYRRGNNMNEGNYIAKVCSAEHKDGRTAQYVIFEVEILTSTYNANDPMYSGCNREGTRATIFCKKNENFASNMKEIILALSGFDPQGLPRPEDDVVTKEECMAAIGPEQPFTGAIVYIEARIVKTKAGGDFTRVSWWPCPLKADGTPDEARIGR